MENSKNILIVEDDINICKITQKYLEKHGFNVHAEHTGETALAYLSSNEVDLVVLDIMLPGIGGFEVCEKAREISDVPIIMLTAKSDISDRIQGLKTGADDYVPKPFDPNELIARIEAVLRRTSANSTTQNHNILKYECLIINKTSYEVFISGKKINMPRREFQLLNFLVSNPNMVFSRSSIIESIWGWDFEGEERVVDLYIDRIRKRLKIDIGVNWSLKTVWGIGYKFEVLKDA